MGALLSLLTKKALQTHYAETMLLKWITKAHRGFVKPLYTGALHIIVIGKNWSPKGATT